MTLIIIEAREDEVNGRYDAIALGYAMHSQGNSLADLRAMVKDAVDY